MTKIKLNLTDGDWLSQVIEPYPASAFKFGSRVPQPIVRDIRSFAELWMTEGIPYAFRARPVIYQKTREAIAERLKISSKDVSLVGSARIGFSLAATKFGEPYVGGRSDLDIFVVSSRLFADLKADFDQWMEDWENGYIDTRIYPTHYWEENVNVLTNNMARRFIDVNKIPALEQCKTVRRCLSITEDLPAAIKEYLTSECPTRASIRAYKDWRAAIKQISTNIVFNLRKLGHLRTEVK